MNILPLIDPDAFDIAVHRLSALAAGGVIGLERSDHGRPAGFCTHTLVCLASSLLMLVTLYQAKSPRPRVTGSRPRRGRPRRRTAPPIARA